MGNENETVFVDDAGVDVVDDTAIDSDWYGDIAEPGAADDDAEPDAGAAADQQDDEAQDDTQDAPEADEGEAPAEEGGTDEPDGEKQEADQSFTLKHLDEVKVVGHDEVVALAQKGLDYDRIRTKYDDLKAQSEKPNAYEQFVREIAERSGMTPEQMIDDAKAQMISEREGIDKAVAVERLRVKRELEAKEAEKAQVADTKPQDEPDPGKIAEQQAQARRDREIQEFFSVFRGVDPATVPKDVWTDVAKGISLVNAYQAHLNRSEIARIEAERKAAENAQNSTGSRSTVGADKGKDQIETDWYSD